MDDLFKKIIYTGVGFAASAYRKLDEMADELQKEGKITEEDAEELLNRFKKKTEQSREEMEDDFKALLERILHRMNVPTRDEITALENRITDLEQQLQEVENKQ